MESKRIKFALIICVFALYGCVSTSSVGVEEVKTIVNFKNNASSNALHTNLMSKGIQQESIEVLAFQAYEPIHGGNPLFTNLRNEQGELLAKSDFEQYTKKMNNKLKEERKKQIVMEKKRKEKQRLKKMEKESKASFSPKITTYGVDCFGCGGEDGSGGTSVGIKLDINRGVLMPNGSWQQGIKYGNYYIVAADPSIPACSILKISNHGLSGSGITPDEPYYAIVLDRGGAIQGSHLDLYIGSENSGAIVPVKQTIPKAEIIRVGGKDGSRSCAL